FGQSLGEKNTEINKTKSVFKIYKINIKTLWKRSYLIYYFEFASCKSSKNQQGSRSYRAVATGATRLLRKNLIRSGKIGKVGNFSHILRFAKCIFVPTMAF